MTAVTSAAIPLEFAFCTVGAPEKLWRRRERHKGGNDFPPAIGPVSFYDDLAVIFIRDSVLRPYRGLGLRGEVFEMEVRHVSGV
jgi:hypothetical protein